MVFEFHGEQISRRSLESKTKARLIDMLLIYAEEVGRLKAAQPQNGDGQPNREAAGGGHSDNQHSNGAEPAEICPNCHGAGNIEVSHINQCSACGGTGKLRHC